MRNFPFPYFRWPEEFRPRYGEPWRPDIKDFETQPIVTRAIEAVGSEASAVEIPTGTPKHVTNVTATESPTRQIDRVLSLVSISFTRDGKDKFFAGVRIWVKGYKGNDGFVLIADAADSPVHVLLESTNEDVVIGVQAFGPTGLSAPFDTMPTAIVKLDGIVSAPPAPTIAQTKIAIANGFQFQFNFLTGLIADVIDGYWIYRRSTNTTPTPPADRYKFVKHPQFHQGKYTFQDVVATTQYYWVSAVNLSGLESSLTSAEGDGSGGGGSNNILRPTSFTHGAVGYANPTNAFDGNESTASSTAVGHTNTSTKQTTWHSFPAASGSPTAISLKVLNGGGSSAISYRISLEYSTNSGSSFTSFPGFPVTSGSYSNRTESVSLSPSQNMTQVQVRAKLEYLSGTGGAGHSVFEVWAEVTT